MQPQNYCRQMVKQFSASAARPGMPLKSVQALENAIDLARRSRKFLLPDGGRLFDDLEYRSLDETEPLHLPFEVIALEYYRGNLPLGDENDELCSKAIIFAEELPETIRITPIAWIDSYRLWGPWPQLLLPRTNYLARDRPRKDGRLAVMAYAPQAGFENDYHDELGALLCFVNVLQCRNVAIEKCERRIKMNKSQHDSLPFDTYHVLKIVAPNEPSHGTVSGGTHRSPREHLRRGHIRRINESHHVWVNATVVSAGSMGRVIKDYKLQARSSA